jgi:hypothetical protein
MRSRMTGPTALVATTLLLAGGTSQASFTYTTAQAPSSVTSGGSTVTLTGVTSGSPQNGSTIINAVNAALTTTTAPPATDVFSLTFNDTVAIQTVGDGTVTLLVNQTLQFFRSDTGGEVSTDTLNVGASTLTASDAGFTYTISGIQYAGPTVDNTGAGNGNISYIITETPRTSVPEPASVGMMALGLGLAGFVGVRRSRRRAA